MNLYIYHETSYAYDQPSYGIIQSLKMVPSIHKGQRIISWDISSSVNGNFGSTFRDGVGDIVQTFSTEKKANKFKIKTEGIIETTNQYGILKDHKESISPKVFLRNTELTKPNLQIIELAKKINPDNEDLLKAHQLSNLIADKISYMTGSSNIHNKASDVIKSKKGVCQDFSHLLIACSTFLKMPARYVTGYLVNSQDLSDIESTHAWTEIYMKDLGWVGFDPTNRCCVDDRYIRLCSGLDSIDASPIRGISKNSGLEDFNFSIQVQKKEQ